MAERHNLSDRPGIKENDLVKLGDCAVCGKKLLDADAGHILFYRVTVERCGFEASAIRRRVGLGMQIGGPLAAVMGPNEDLAKIIDGPRSVVVHDGCGDRVPLLLLSTEDKER